MIWRTTYVCYALGRFVQQRQRFALDAPALVIYKMPVQNLQLHTRHLVDDLFHFVRRKEMTGAVRCV